VHYRTVNDPKRRYTLSIDMELLDQLQKEYEDTTKMFMGLVDLEDRNRLKERRKAIRREVLEITNRLNAPGPYWSTTNV
jgi:hypothetical protein